MNVINKQVTGVIFRQRDKPVLIKFTFIVLEYPTST